MDDPLCRVSIQDARRPHLVDLALPRHAELGLLLPDIVGLVVGDEATDVAPQGWRLDRLRGGHCDESMTLHESGVSDGDVMVLSLVDAPAPGPLPENPFHTVSGAEAGPESRPAMSAGFWTCAGLAAVIALGYSGIHGGAPMPAAGTASLSAAVCLIVAWRRDAMRSTLHGLSVGFVCIAGFLAVPGAGGAPGVTFGAAAGCVAALWLLRTAGGDVCSLTAAATASAAVAVVAAFSLVVSVDLAAWGAVLGALSLAVLGAAGRVTLVLNGLRPPFPGEGIADPVSAASAAGAREVFAGLVTGSAAAITLAVGAITTGCLGTTTWLPGFALAAALAALLLLRTRCYADRRCRTALGWCGLICAATAVALATVSAPRYAGPAVVLTVALAAWCRAGRGTRAASWARGADVAEYILLAGVVPLACWVAGVYEVVRSMSVG
ncbi:type VII secretion integral membrane protein EccD [Mycolicibacterium frederiksbergense]|uniref:type VII secretion integral membrane protein EccD n=1 Tax=Mycolicibacterium frederiksbergense TaxID=117567 RepID=UPI00265B9243|nr:type VII secretion integral membrane protein EccD [Mycolicibacterium frederiksbergense]MDO0972641.1 type VII secretion integral membrane protein EccD [Mycolicibacterium frederiksbergense]